MQVVTQWVAPNQLDITYVNNCAKPVVLKSCQESERLYCPRIHEVIDPDGSYTDQAFGSDLTGRFEAYWVGLKNNFGASKCIREEGLRQHTYGYHPKPEVFKAEGEVKPQTAGDVEDTLPNATNTSSETASDNSFFEGQFAENIFQDEIDEISKTTPDVETQNTDVDEISNGSFDFDFTEEIDDLKSSDANSSSFDNKDINGQSVLSDLQDGSGKTRKQTKVKEMIERCDCVLDPTKCPPKPIVLTTCSRNCSPLDKAIQARKSACLDRPLLASEEQEYREIYRSGKRTRLSVPGNFKDYACERRARQFYRKELDAKYEAEERKKALKEAQKKREIQYCEDIKGDLAQGKIPYEPFPAWGREKQTEFDRLSDNLFSESDYQRDKSLLDSEGLKREAEKAKEQLQKDERLAEQRREEKRLREEALKRKKEEEKLFCMSDAKRANLCICTKYYPPNPNMKACGR